MRALATYPGPTQNFVLADTGGRGRLRARRARSPTIRRGGCARSTARARRRRRCIRCRSRRFRTSTPSRERAGRDRQQRALRRGLSGAARADVRAAVSRRRDRAPLARSPGRSTSTRSAAIQADTISVADAELARALRRGAAHSTRADRDPDLGPALAALAAFDGRFDPDSRGATVIQRVRGVAIADLVARHLPRCAAERICENGPAFVTLMRALREHPRGWFPHDDVDAFLTDRGARGGEALRRKDAIATPYGDAYAVVAHAPARRCSGWTSGTRPRFAGSGGSYAPAVQGPVARAELSRGVGRRRLGCRRDRHPARRVGRTRLAALHGSARGWPPRADAAAVQPTPP